MKILLNILLIQTLFNNSIEFSPIISYAKPSYLSTSKHFLKNKINNRNFILNMVSKNNFENNTYNGTNITNMTNIFRITYNNDYLYENDINETNNIILRIYIYAVINVMIFEYIFTSFH